MHQEGAGAGAGAGLFHKGIKLELRIAPQYLRGQGAESNRLRGGNMVNQDEGPSKDQPRAAGRGRARCRPACSISPGSFQEVEQRQDCRLQLNTCSPPGEKSTP